MAVFSVFLLGSFDSVRHVHRTARIVECLRAPFTLGAEDVRIGASIGCASSPFKPTDLDGLLVRADEESYRIKSIRRRGMPVDRVLPVLACHV